MIPNEPFSFRLFFYGLPFIMVGKSRKLQA